MNPIGFVLVKDMLGKNEKSLKNRGKLFIRNLVYFFARNIFNLRDIPLSKLL